MQLSIVSTPPGCRNNRKTYWNPYCVTPICIIYPALVQLNGGKVKQIPVRHFPRYAGTSKYHLFNRLLDPFIDTLAFVWIKKRHISYQFNGQSRISKITNEHTIANG